MTEEDLAAIEAAAKAAAQGARDGEVIASLCPERVLALVAHVRALQAKAAEWDRWLRKMPCGHTAHVLTPDSACVVCNISDVSAALDEVGGGEPEAT